MIEKNGLKRKVASKDLQEETPLTQVARSTHGGYKGKCPGGCTLLFNKICEMHYIQIVLTVYCQNALFTEIELQCKSENKSKEFVDSIVWGSIVSPKQPC